MPNPKRNKILIQLWVKNKKQLEDLKNAVNNNDKQETHRLAHDILNDEANK